MADIFISYSQKDRSIAEELARFLDDCGYSVWWDYELVGGTKFRKEIEAQLKLAKAAIVIWTENSVESSFVLDEAQVAQSMGKLLPTRVPDLAYQFVPLGFKQLQTDLISKPDRILKSLEEFGVAPSKPPVRRTAAPVEIAGGLVDPTVVAAADQFANWEFIKDSSRPADFQGYIQRFAASPLAELARSRLGLLEDAAWAAAERSREAADLRAFVTGYPDGRHHGAARRLLMTYEREAYGRLDKTDPEALAAFLKLYPDGLTADDVRGRLADVEQTAAEARAWAAIAAAPTRAGLETYLAKFPFGAHADAAKQSLAPVILAEKRADKWAKIREAGYSEQLRAFIDEFEHGPEVEEARARLAKRMREKEEAEWVTVQDTRQPAALLRFVRTYADGARREAALAALAKLPATLEAEAWAEIETAKEPALFAAYLSAFPAGAHAGEARTRSGGKASMFGFGATVTPAAVPPAAAAGVGPGVAPGVGAAATTTGETAATSGMAAAATPASQGARSGWQRNALIAGGLITAVMIAGAVSDGNIATFTAYMVLLLGPPAGTYWWWRQRRAAIAELHGLGAKRAAATQQETPSTGTASATVPRRPALVVTLIWLAAGLASAFATLVMLFDPPMNNAMANFYADEVALLVVGGMAASVVMGWALWRVVTHILSKLAVAPDISGAIGYWATVTPMLLVWAIAQYELRNRHQNSGSTNIDNISTSDDGVFAATLVMVLLALAVATAFWPAAWRLRRGWPALIALVVGGVAAVLAATNFVRFSLVPGDYLVTNSIYLYAAAAITLNSLLWLLWWWRRPKS